MKLIMKLNFISLAVLLLTACGEASLSSKSNLRSTADELLAEGNALNGEAKDKDVAGKDGKVGKDGDEVVSKDPSKAPGKGSGKEHHPSQNPNQVPNEDGGDSGKTPPIVLDKCPYFDPDQPNWFIAKDQFGPNLPPMDVMKTAIKGELYGDTYIGAFTLYAYSRADRTTYWRDVWDGKAGRVPHDYTMVVTDTQDERCTAFLRYVKQNPRTLNGCFDLNTKIRMADGSDMVIAAISEGDYVWNPVLKKKARVAEVVKGKEDKKSMYEVGFGGKLVVLTETHPVPVKGSIKQAKNLTKDDVIKDEKGVWHKITHLVKRDPNAKQVVVNIRLDSESSNPDHHMVLAEGIITGDLYLQRKLAEHTPKVAQKN